MGNGNRLGVDGKEGNGFKYALWKDHWIILENRHIEGLLRVNKQDFCSFQGKQRIW